MNGKILVGKCSEGFCQEMRIICAFFTANENMTNCSIKKINLPFCFVLKELKKYLF
jgi:hypothetical protein